MGSFFLSYQPRGRVGSWEIPGEIGWEVFYVISGVNQPAIAKKKRCWPKDKPAALRWFSLNVQQEL
jgi:hypothetical protein